MGVNDLFRDLSDQRIDGLDKNGKAIKGKIVEGVVIFSDSLLLGESPLLFHFYSKDIFDVIDGMKDKVIALQQNPVGSDIGLEEIEPQIMNRNLSLILNVVDKN